MLYLDIDKSVEHEATLQLSRIYLHGDIQDMVGYDLVRTDDIRLYNKIYNCHHEEKRFRHLCGFLSPKKINYDVNMYIWYHVETGWQGLVCLVDDKDANDYALLKYDMKTQFI